MIQDFGNQYHMKTCPPIVRIVPVLVIPLASAIQLLPQIPLRSNRKFGVMLPIPQTDQPSISGLPNFTKTIIPRDVTSTPNPNPILPSSLLLVHDPTILLDASFDRPSSSTRITPILDQPLPNIPLPSTSLPTTTSTDQPSTVPPLFTSLVGFHEPIPPNDDDEDNGRPHSVPPVSRSSKFKTSSLSDTEPDSLLPDRQQLTQDFRAFSAAMAQIFPSPQEASWMV